jgi:predicted nuclease with TOPRIM domain
MSEINETPEPTEPQPKSVEELTAEIATLTKELETANFWRNRTSTSLTELESKVEQLEEYLDENWDSLDDHAESIAEIFGIDTEVEKEVSVSISGTMTIKAPRSYDWDDLSYSSFEVSIETNWSETFSIESFDLEVNDTTVED